MPMTSVSNLSDGLHLRTALSRNGWGPSETEMHLKLFQSSSEYSELNRMCILINATIIPGNASKDSTS